MPITWKRTFIAALALTAVLAACSDQTDNSNISTGRAGQTDIEIAQSLYQSFGESDLEAIRVLMDENIVWEFPGPPGVLPLTGTFNGPDEVIGWVITLGQELDLLAFTPQQFVADGSGTVIVLGDERVRVRANGKEYETKWAHSLQIVDGKITHFNEYTDTAVQVIAYE